MIRRSCPSFSIDGRPLSRLALRSQLISAIIWVGCVRDDRVEELRLGCGDVSALADRPREVCAQLVYEVKDGADKILIEVMRRIRVYKVQRLRIAFRDDPFFSQKARRACDRARLGEKRGDEFKV